MANMDDKMKDKEFINYIHVVLRPGIEYDNERAYEIVRAESLEKI